MSTLVWSQTPFFGGICGPRNAVTKGMEVLVFMDGDIGLMNTWIVVGVMESVSLMEALSIDLVSGWSLLWPIVFFPQAVKVNSRVESEGHR